MKKFNINGRICLEVSTLFGILGLVLIYILNPLFIKLLSFIPSVVTTIIFIIILLLFILDFVVSFKIITNIKQVDLNEIKDNTEEITKIVRNTLMRKSALNRRLAKAFPNFQVKTLQFQKQIQKIKRKINKNE